MVQGLSPQLGPGLQGSFAAVLNLVREDDVLRPRNRDAGRAPLDWGFLHGRFPPTESLNGPGREGEIPHARHVVPEILVSSLCVTQGKTPLVGYCACAS